MSTCLKLIILVKCRLIFFITHLSIVLNKSLFYNNILNIIFYKPYIDVRTLLFE